MGFGNLGSDSVRAEIFQRVALDGVNAHGRVGLNSRETSRDYYVLVLSSTLLKSNGFRTEELLSAATFLNDLDQTGFQLLDGRNMVRKNTHLARLSGNVDLNDVLRLINGLRAAISSCPPFVMPVATATQLRAQLGKSS